MKNFKPKAWLLPQPVLIIGTYDTDGTPNAMNAAWGGQWDMNEIMISMGAHATTENLNRNGEFTVAFATTDTLTASDYVVNRSREELMMVSTINRDKFTRDMEAVNGMLRAVKQSGNSTAIIYSTYSSDKLIEGRITDTYGVTRSATRSINGNTLAQMVVTSDRDDARQFYAPRCVTMNVSANSSSRFYLYQLSLGDTSNPDAGILIVAGVNTPQPCHSYIISNNGNSDWLSVKGMNLVGDGTLSVSFSQ